MTIRGFPVRFLMIGFAALLLIGQLHASELDHKLMLIMWTIIFYAAIAFHNQDKRLGVSSPMAYRPEHLDTYSATEELFDTDRIAMQCDGHEWNPAIQASNSDEIH
jgi:hypothetical protein